LRLRRPDVSEPLEALVLSALARNPELRPTADRLARLLAHTVADPYTPLDEPS
jgi:hypothetical protein